MRLGFPMVCALSVSLVASTFVLAAEPVAESVSSEKTTVLAGLDARVLGTQRAGSLADLAKRFRAEQERYLWISPPLAAFIAAKTPLYRAVKPGELADIQKTGQLINRGSAEGKYFTSSAEDAAAYAKKAVAGFKDPPYTIIKTEVPTASLPKPVSVDGGIPAYVIPNEALPGLTPQVMPTMPIPGVR